MKSQVQAVSLSPKHGFSKQPQPSIMLLANQGVQGDAHCGATVQHLYLKRRNPVEPNRMQVHLLQSELLDELTRAGFAITPGQLGENVTTCGIDLLTLPVGTRLHLGNEAVLELTGLRTPCSKIDAFQPGLLKQLVDSTKAPKAGVMAIVLTGGDVAAGNTIRIELPPAPHTPLHMI
jgi:MOSC domain-containing protein YiiM